MEKVKKLVKCDRCGGRGFYAVGVHNGQLVIAQPDNGVCYKCGGSGMMQFKRRSGLPRSRPGTKRQRPGAKRRHRPSAKLKKLPARRPRESQRKPDWRPKGRKRQNASRTSIEGTPGT